MDTNKKPFVLVREKTDSDYTDTAIVDILYLTPEEEKDMQNKVCILNDMTTQQSQTDWIERDISYEYFLVGSDTFTKDCKFPTTGFVDLQVPQVIFVNNYDNLVEAIPSSPYRNETYSVLFSDDMYDVTIASIREYAPVPDFDDGLIVYLPNTEFDEEDNFHIYLFNKDFMKEIKECDNNYTVFKEQLRSKGDELFIKFVQYLDENFSLDKDSRKHSGIICPIHGDEFGKIKLISKPW